MRSALRRLLTTGGFVPRLYASGTEILAQAQLEGPGCILLDVRMPGMDGLQVQTALNERGIALPIIFLTGSADIPVAVTAMRHGAEDFIEKPFENNHLIERVNLAVEHYLRDQSHTLEREQATSRRNRLTPREREVLDQVVTGRTSKEIARELGASHRTIEIHRRNLMEKMQAATLADLIRMRLLVAD